MASVLRRIAVLLGASTVTHPDGKVFVRVMDHWMPL